jgi:hypothetical protein
MAWVSERTIPTERQPLAGEISANVLRIKGATWSAWRIPRPYSRLSRPSQTLTLWQNMIFSIAGSSAASPENQQESGISRDVCSEPEWLLQRRMNLLNQLAQAYNRCFESLGQFLLPVLIRPTEPTVWLASPLHDYHKMADASFISGCLPFFGSVKLFVDAKHVSMEGSSSISSSSWEHAYFPSCRHFFRQVEDNSASC